MLTLISRLPGLETRPRLINRVCVHLVEAWFSLAERQAIHRGTYTSVKDLNAKIRAYIDGWNNRAHPSTGLRPPTRSSPRPTVRRSQMRSSSFPRTDVRGSLCPPDSLTLSRKFRIIGLPESGGGLRHRLNQRRLHGVRIRLAPEDGNDAELRSVVCWPICAQLNASEGANKFNM
jgi:hypothetical protein